MPKSIKHVVRNYDALNEHTKGVLDNEKQLRRLKRFKTDRVFIKNLGLLLLVLGMFAILATTAYYIYIKSNPIQEVVEKIVFQDREVIVEVPVPVPPGSKFGKFTIFHKETIDRGGIGYIITGKDYNSEDDYKSQTTNYQYCYATSQRNPDIDITLAILKEGKTVYKDLYSGIRSFSLTGASNDDVHKLRVQLIKMARQYCQFEANL
jgi:hypothetical protein